MAATETSQVNICQFRLLSSASSVKLLTIVVLGRVGAWIGVGVTVHSRPLGCLLPSCMRLLDSSETNSEKGMSQIVDLSVPFLDAQCPFPIPLTSPWSLFSLCWRMMYISSNIHMLQVNIDGNVGFSISRDMWVKKVR